MINTIYIRADANEEIGTGHIMRCLSIANNLLKLDCSVIFVVADEKSQSFITDRDFDSICMHTAWNNLESELPIIKGIILENQIKSLLIDNYFVTENYLKQLNQITDVSYIDDLDSFVYPVNTVINYNIYAKDLNYQKKYTSTNLNTKFILGTAYIPLREEFSNIPKRKYREIKNILITSGGTDNYNMISNILIRYGQEADFRAKEFYCVIGAFNVNKDSIFNQYACYENVHLLYNISNVSEYMNKCDICITAGGSTLYELCACGTPSIAFSLADNQIRCLKKVSDMDLIPWVGDVRHNMEDCLDRIIFEAHRLESKKRWENISYKMQNIVDGKGAKRLAELLVG